MTFTIEHFIEKLKTLSSSQQSVNTVSQWVIFYNAHIKEIAATWHDHLKQNRPDRKLLLLYLANDILQNCKKHAKSDEICLEFSKVLPSAMVDMSAAPEKERGSTSRLLGIWRERAIYRQEFLTFLQNCFSQGMIVPGLEAIGNVLPIPVLNDTSGAAAAAVASHHPHHPHHHHHPNDQQQQHHHDGHHHLANNPISPNRSYSSTLSPRVHQHPVASAIQHLEIAEKKSADVRAQLDASVSTVMGSYDTATKEEWDRAYSLLAEQRRCLIEIRVTRERYLKLIEESKKEQEARIAPLEASIAEVDGTLIAFQNFQAKGIAEGNHLPPPPPMETQQSDLPPPPPMIPLEDDDDIGQRMKRSRSDE